MNGAAVPAFPNVIPMRIPISLAALVLFASVHAAPVAAQSDAAPIPPAPALAPLPAALLPDDAPAAAVEAAARFSARRFLVSVGVGTLVGAGTGLVVGAVTADRCQPDEWCILGWEEEVAIHGVAGAMVGAGVGAVYGLVTGFSDSPSQPAPVTVVPSADSGVRVGVTLRH